MCSSSFRNRRPCRDVVVASPYASRRQTYSTRLCRGGCQGRRSARVEKLHKSATAMLNRVIRRVLHRLGIMASLYRRKTARTKAAHRILEPRDLVYHSCTSLHAGVGSIWLSGNESSQVKCHCSRMSPRRQEQVRFTSTGQIHQRRQTAAPGLHFEHGRLWLRQPDWLFAWKKPDWRRVRGKEGKGGGRIRTDE